MSIKFSNAFFCLSGYSYYKTNFVKQYVNYVGQGVGRVVNRSNLRLAANDCIHTWAICEEHFNQTMLSV